VDGADEMLDVASAAALVRRHPETVRRWIWSGRLRARRQGNRFFVARGDLEAAARRSGMVDIREWAERARAHRERTGTKGSGRSAADLVIEDRARRSASANASAGR
jgi:hypothetical protein